MRVIKINGYNFAVTEEGRFRFNWKNQIRARDRLNLPDFGQCSVCGKEKDLTVHHDPPLSKSITGEKHLMCEECHKELHRNDGASDNPAFIVTCYCGDSNYLKEDSEESIIVCFSCGTKRVLKRVGTDEYELDLLKARECRMTVLDKLVEEDRLTRLRGSSADKSDKNWWKKFTLTQY